MGRGLKKSNWNSAAGCEFTVHSVVSKKVLWVSLETSFDALAVIDADADHFQEAVLGAVGIAGVIKCLGKSPGQADVLIELADGKQSGIAGELAVRWLQDDGSSEEIQVFLPGRQSTHRCSPVESGRPVTPRD